MFLKTHNKYGKVVLVNLDNVACINDGRIVYMGEDEGYTPLETSADIMDALDEANLVICTGGTSGSTNYHY